MRCPPALTAYFNLRPEILRLHLEYACPRNDIERLTQRYLYYPSNKTPMASRLGARPVNQGRRYVFRVPRSES